MSAVSEEPAKNGIYLSVWRLQSFHLCGFLQGRCSVLNIAPTHASGVDDEVLTVPPLIQPLIDCRHPGHNTLISHKMSFTSVMVSSLPPSRSRPPPLTLKTSSAGLRPRTQHPAGTGDPGGHREWRHPASVQRQRTKAESKPQQGPNWKYTLITFTKRPVHIMSWFIGRYRRSKLIDQLTLYYLHHEFSN